MSSVSDEFISRLSILKEAGTSLIVTRAREPYEVCRSVRRYVMALNKENARIKDEERLAYGTWNALEGLTIEKAEELSFNEGNLFKTTPEADKKTNLRDMRDLVKTFQFFTNKLSHEELKLLRQPNGLPIGIYDMVWPQSGFEKDSCKAALLHIAEEFTYSPTCIILIIPVDIQVPSELIEFVTFLDFDAPKQSERLEDVLGIINTYELDLFDNVHKIALAASSLTGFEIRTSLSIIVKEMKVANEEITSENLAARIQAKKSEIINRSGLLDVLSPVESDQAAGLEYLKQYMLDAGRCYSDEALEVGVDRPKGLGLFGGPGTGKTYMASVAGSILGMVVYRLDLSKLMQKYVGETEGLARIVFNLLIALSPCAVFVDEIDKMFSGSDEEAGGGAVPRRLLSMILSFMQESTHPIFWILAANRLKGLPPEMLRKERLDALFSVAPPTKSERLSILKIHLAKRKKNPDEIPNLHVAVKASKGFVSAEIVAAVKEAVKENFLRSRPLDGELIAEQLKLMKPISIAFAKDFKEMSDWADAVARPASMEEDEDDESEKVTSLRSERRKRSKKE